MEAKKVNLMLKQYKACSINLNAQHVNGMTPFDFNKVESGNLIFVRLLEYRL